MFRWTCVLQLQSWRICSDAATVTLNRQTASCFHFGAYINWWLRLKKSFLLCENRRVLMWHKLVFDCQHRSQDLSRVFNEALRKRKKMFYLIRATDVFLFMSESCSIRKKFNQSQSLQVRALPSTELQFTMIVIMHQNTMSLWCKWTQLEAIYNMLFMKKDCIALHCLPFKTVLFEQNQQVDLASLQSTEVRKSGSVPSAASSSESRGHGRDALW